LNGDGGWPSGLRWAPDVLARPSPPVKPGIIGDARDANGNVTGIHRIFFNRWGRVEHDRDGRKSKICLGGIWGSAALTESDPDPDGRWGVAEGIETAMACRQLYGFPVWAAIFGGNMAAITPPKWATNITVFADHDLVCTKPGPLFGKRPGLF